MSLSEKTPSGEDKMRAKLSINQMKIGGSASEYLRLVRNATPIPTKTVDESHRREAQEILESIREQDNSGYELDINIEGKNLIDQMDKDFESVGLVPYHFSKSAAEAGEAISVGSRISIPGDERQFKVVSISRHYGAVCIRDASGSEYLIPWQLVQPWRE